MAMRGHLAAIGWIVVLAACRERDTVPPTPLPPPPLVLPVADLALPLCERGAPAEPLPPATSTTVRVDQLGYLPTGPKRAMLADDDPARLPWVLRSDDDRILAHGHTIAFGHDAAAAERVHTADFGCFEGTERSVRLQIGDADSPAFDVADDVFLALRRDALAFFYLHRSGVEITECADPSWCRPAGHPDDASIECDPLAPCAKRVDASGGWYGDGSSGKYVVGSGLAVWTLQNMVERARVLGVDARALSDGDLAIPESKNGIPDVLDEARVQLEFMLRMQLPDGHPRAGMVHHKVEGETWLALDVAPHEDHAQRFARAPTTGATLVLAAVAAQAARLWRPHDEAFARRCTEAAERAYAAARKNPVINVSWEESRGGHPYDDGGLSDEAYWASAELLLTTGDLAYRDLLLASPHHLELPPPQDTGMPTVLDWRTTQVLGTIDLALVPGALPSETVAALRSILRTIAAGYLVSIGGSGYRLPLPRRPYGSATTIDVLHDAMLMAFVYDFTQEPRYLMGVVDSLDFVLGRNALGRTFVTGHGDDPVRHPHHRFYARNRVPPGILVNGPNATYDDPVANAALVGCAPQKCWLDDRGAYSLESVADHGNAALAWVAAWLSETRP